MSFQSIGSYSGPHIWGDGPSITRTICPPPNNLLKDIKNASLIETEIPEDIEEMYSDLKAYWDYHHQLGAEKLSPNVIGWLKNVYSENSRNVRFTVDPKYQKYNTVLKDLVKTLESATKFSSENGAEVFFKKKTDKFARRFDGTNILLDGDNTLSDLAVTIHEAGHALGFPHPFHLPQFRYIDTIYNNIMSYNWDDDGSVGPSRLSNAELQGLSPICKDLARTFGTVFAMMLPEIYGQHPDSPNCTEELNDPLYHSRIFSPDQDNSYLGQVKNFIWNFANPRAREAYYASYYNQHILNVVNVRLLIVNHLLEKTNNDSAKHDTLFLASAILDSAAASPWKLSGWEIGIAEHYQKNNDLPSIKNLRKSYFNCSGELPMPLKYNTMQRVALIASLGSLGHLFTAATAFFLYKCRLAGKANAPGQTTHGFIAVPQSEERV